MTENEKVKKWFATELSMREEESLDAIDCEDIMDICVKALEEIQQYRAIGTVEDIRFIVENIGSIKLLKEYTAIGTIDEFKALKEKNEPKKAIGKRKYDEAYCPACNEVISDGEFWALDEYVHHCNYCGQAVKGVDWSE